MDLGHSLSQEDKHQRNKLPCSFHRTQSSDIKSSLSVRHPPDLLSPFCCNHRLGFLDVLDSYLIHVPQLGVQHVPFLKHVFINIKIFTHFYFIEAYCLGKASGLWGVDRKA